MKIRVSSGSEGPSHDLYSYEEWDIEYEGRLLEIHLGLAVWAKIDKKDIDLDYDLKNLDQICVEFCGLTFKWVKRAYERMQNRCSKCGCKTGREVEGYPGESFTVCDNCGAFFNYYFNESAVI